MADADNKEEEETAVQPDEEVAETAVDDKTKPTEATEEAAGGSGKPFIVYYNALSRVVMAAFLIAAGSYTLPDVWLKSPTKDFKLCCK